MKEKMVTSFLPLGSIVKLNGIENDPLLYLIIARGIVKNEREEIISRYKVAPHPFGDVPSQKIFTVNANQITEIKHEGYSDQTDEEFLNDLFVKITNSPEAVTKTPGSKESIEIEIDLFEKEKLKKDAFYKFRKGNYE